jgi:hypothetical protein
VTVDSDVTEAVQTVNGALIQLDRSGDLWGTSAQGRIQLDSQVQQIAVSNGAYVFALHSDLHLFVRYGDGSGGSSPIDSGIQSIASSGGSYVFELNGSGSLGTMTNQSQYTSIDTGVQAIASSGSSYVFALHTDADLFTRYGDGSGGSNPIDTGVQAIASSGSSYVFDHATQGSSLGLLGMEERVLLRGGHFHIESSAGEGTEIRARFPLGSGVPMSRQDEELR